MLSYFWENWADPFFTWLTPTHLSTIRFANFTSLLMLTLMALFEVAALPSSSLISLFFFTFLSTYWHSNISWEQRSLFNTLVDPKPLEQCLACSSLSLNFCWMNELSFTNEKTRAWDVSLPWLYDLKEGPWFPVSAPH